MMVTLGTLLILASLSLTFALSDPSSEQVDCSALYCRGDLLHDVQMSGIYEDSKTFVDKRLQFPPEEVELDYRTLRQKYNGSVPVEEIRKFVDEKFQDGSELLEWIPPDWVPEPSVLSKVYDESLRNWARKLNVVWKHLSRRISPEVLEKPEMFSLIYVPHGFIIPGGRFKELYYWDTFWIIKGLIKCDMRETAKGMIINLMTLVQKLGFVPNGNRVYYEGRSHPPLLVHMVNYYYEATQDLEFLKDTIDVLDSEMEFWINNRSVTVEARGSQHTLFHYDVTISRPRPESYREDWTTVGLVDEALRGKKYQSIRAAAESGWDFSSRWFIKDGTNHGNMSDVNTQFIIPVDLNALLHKGFTHLIKMHQLLQNKAKQKYYRGLATNLKTAILRVLWHEDVGIWLDYDALNKKRRNYFYMSNFVPLWTGSHSFNKDVLTSQIMSYIRNSELEKYIGGIPASLEKTGEQWDYPNAWPPLQAFLIQGLETLGTPRALEFAFNLAQKWIYTNYKSFEDSGRMYEKYNAEMVGQTGGGGEYVPQDGFGWTNGVVFELLDRWGFQLRKTQA